MQILVREHISDPVKMWDALKKLHEQDNPTAHYLAYHSFLSIQKQENESLKQLTSRVERALHDVRNTHKAELTLDKFEEELACAVLCCALPEKFSSFRSAVLLKPDFGWEALKSSFILEDDNRRGIEPQASAMHVFTPAQKHSKDITCKFYSIKGHVKATCFKKQNAIKAVSVGIIILTHSLFTILTYAHLCTSLFIVYFIVLDCLCFILALCDAFGHILIM